MKEVLIIAATALELDPVKEKMEELDLSDLKLKFLVSGVGSTLTAFHLGTFLAQNQIDLALNIGIAGAFDTSLNLAQVVQVVEDRFGDEGVEDDTQFLTTAEAQLRDLNEFPFINELLKSDSPNGLELSSYQKVKGITINRVHGNAQSIKNFTKKFDAQIESMEGAAFFYACLYHRISCVQLRAISNYVEVRDRSKWQIDHALKNLSEATEQIIQSSR